MVSVVDHRPSTNPDGGPRPNQFMRVTVNVSSDTYELIPKTTLRAEIAESVAPVFYEPVRKIFFKGSGPGYFLGQQDESSWDLWMKISEPTDFHENLVLDFMKYYACRSNIFVMVCFKDLQGCRGKTFVSETFSRGEEDPWGPWTSFAHFFDHSYFNFFCHDGKIVFHSDKTLYTIDPDVRVSPSQQTIPNLLVQSRFTMNSFYHRILSNVLICDSNLKSSLRA